VRAVCSTGRRGCAANVLVHGGYSRTRDRYALCPNSVNAAGGGTVWVPISWTDHPPGTGASPVLRLTARLTPQRQRVSRIRIGPTSRLSRLGPAFPGTAVKHLAGPDSPKTPVFRVAKSSFTTCRRRAWRSSSSTPCWTCGPVVTVPVRAWPLLVPEVLTALPSVWLGERILYRSAPEVRPAAAAPRPDADANHYRCSITDTELPRLVT
jgi:hypothetical protein